MAQRKQRKPNTALYLRKLEPGVLARARYDIAREGQFRWVLRAAFIKSFELARYSNRLKLNQADEASFFMASAVRGVCEDLIVLKFLRRLQPKMRDEVIGIEMVLATRKAADAQAKFFAKVRRFQPVLRLKNDPTRAQADKDRLTKIGQDSGLWNTKGKLPPIEQMADKVALRSVYDYSYRVTSDIVHFSPRILLRSGWGPSLREGTFRTKNFSRYYLNFTQFYSIYLFELLCRTFRKDLALSTAFMATVGHLRSLLDQELRWPEAVTYEEMNEPEPGSILTSFLWMFHEQKTRPKERREVLKAAVVLGQGPPSRNVRSSEADSEARLRRILIPMIRAEMRRRQRQPDSLHAPRPRGETQGGTLKVLA